MFTLSLCSYVVHICSYLPVIQFPAVQNGTVTQKDTLNDDEFEPYLNTQTRQVCLLIPYEREHVKNESDCVN